MDEYVQLPLPLFDVLDGSENVSANIDTSEAKIEKLSPPDEVLQPQLIGFQELLLDAELLPAY